MNSSDLVKGIYGGEFSSKRGPFGFAAGQMRACDLVHNGGWYNKIGEKLGWGDLSPWDLADIRDEIPAGEAWVVLNESDSFWNFVQNVGMLGCMCTTKPTIDAPGIEYMAEHARFLIIRGEIFKRGWDDAEPRKEILWDMVEVTTISPAKMGEMIRSL